MDTVLAEMIIRNHTFPSIKDLHDLLGTNLDEDQFEALYATVLIPINLNSACESKILLIPGDDNRMAHEFKEYLPYSNIERFRLKSVSMWMKRKSHDPSST
ncbi:MAG: hypothetical protein VYD01_04800 [Pseudomonadota bacterium]|nr:hypothetical protein [Pseudomonadota bacterium]